MAPHRVQISTEKLALKLLRLAPEGAAAGKHLLAVNFDPQLVNLLRETKYFIALGVDVPAEARNVHERSKTFRRHIGSLELVVAVWNRIQQTILPVELPLVRPQIEELHVRLDDGLRALDWNSTTIDKYIDEVKARRPLPFFLQVFTQNSWDCSPRDDVQGESIARCQDSMSHRAGHG